MNLHVIFVKTTDKFAGKSELSTLHGKLENNNYMNRRCIHHRPLSHSCSCVDLAETNANATGRLKCSTH